MKRFSFFFLLAAALHGMPAGVPADAVKHPSGLWVQRTAAQEGVWFASGQLKARGPLKAGQRQGNWEFFTEKGKLRARGPYEAGKMHGSWEIFASSGYLLASGAYRGGQKDGPWNYFFSSGKKESEGSYVRGKKHGPWVNYYASGQVFYRGNYEYGQAHGPWEYYFENGKIHQKGQFLSDVRSGSWYICIFSEGPCQSQSFDQPKAPRISSMPPADSKNFARDTSNPAAVLESMDSGPVPDKVPAGLGNKWD